MGEFQQLGDQLLDVTDACSHGATNKLLEDLRQRRFVTAKYSADVTTMMFIHTNLKVKAFMCVMHVKIAQCD